MEWPPRKEAGITTSGGEAHGSRAGQYPSTLIRCQAKPAALANRLGSSASLAFFPSVGYSPRSRGAPSGNYQLLLSTIESPCTPPTSPSCSNPLSPLLPPTTSD